RLDALAEECAETFPVSSIGVIALAAYKKRFRSRFYRLKDKLLRKTTMSYYMFCELQHYSRLVDNLIPNFYRMERSFDANGLRGEFKGIPAIICGAGPSLCNDIEVLRTLSDKALLFAGGSTIAALGSHGIFPHFGVACDPNEEELVRFKTSSTLHFPLLYFARLYPEVFKTFNGPTGYIQSHTGGPVGCWMEEKLGLSSQLLLKGMTGEANSVTTSMVQLAYSYGCDPIIFLGTDLAFTEGKAYASGVTPSENPGMKVRKEDVRAAEKFLTRTDIYGKPVSTLTKWVMDQEAISSFAKKNRQTTFINATSGGLGFKRIPNTPLKDIPLTKSYDLSAKVHRAIETHPLPIPPGKVEEILSSLKESLKKAKEYVHIAIEELEKSKGKDPETGRFIFAQMEFEALDAYTTLLCTQDCSFTTLYNREHRSTSFSQESLEDKWHFLDAKWRSYQTLIDTYLSIL
ncbi:MAG: DUF115 domain-containing protein, partial [Chlamydiia bacterium]|nr:DUF115 domain-containing protein [Chlamydiia bacterium]